MNTVLFPIIFVFVIIFSIFLLSRKYNYLTRSYYQGVGIWSAWLPMVSIFGYLLIFSINLVFFKSQLAITKMFDLSWLFSTWEMILLFFVGPLFLTRAGNFLGFLVLLFVFEKINLGKTLEMNIFVTHLLVGFTTIITILSDKMTWIQQSRYFSPIKQKVRELLLYVIALGAMGILFYIVIKCYSFNRWFSELIDFRLSPRVTVLIITILMLGWLSVLVGSYRHVVIPILSLPTLFAVAFATSWPSYFLMVPFVVCLTLSLTSPERRLIPRTRGIQYFKTTNI